MLLFTGQMSEHNSIDVQFSINMYSFDHGIFFNYCTYDYVATIRYIGRSAALQKGLGFLDLAMYLTQSLQKTNCFL